MKGIQVAKVVDIRLGEQTSVDMLDGEKCFLKTEEVRPRRG